MCWLTACIQRVDSKDGLDYMPSFFLIEIKCSETIVVFVLPRTLDPEI